MADEYIADTPLQGVRVLDLAQGIAGPFAAKWLGALGADVIKIEPPTGDPTRAWGPWPHDQPDAETSGTFLYLNTCKRSVTLNLELSAGQEILRTLCAKADIVIESFAPGYLGERGLSHTELAAVQPSLVMVSVTPFGQDGPYADLPATDLTLAALCGQLWRTGDAAMPPLKNGGSQPSYQAGLHAFTAALIAYYGALVQGEGRHIDVAILETYASQLDFPLGVASQRGEEHTRDGNRRHASWAVYPCADGYAGLCCPPRIFDRLGAAIGVPELRDPRFVDPVLRRDPDVDGELEAILRTWLLNERGKDLFQLAMKERFPAGYVATIAEVAESEQLRQRDYFTTEQHPRAGSLQVPGRLWLSDAYDWRRDRAPQLGEHTAAICHEELGYAMDEIARLRAQGAI